VLDACKPWCAGLLVWVGRWRASHCCLFTPSHTHTQDALFTRGTSATPDLPSGGKPRLPRGLFSPAAQRSGSSSSGKVAPRRGLLGGSDTGSPGGRAADTDDERHGSQPSGEWCWMGMLVLLQAVC
jgi:hypothetical protein